MPKVKTSAGVQRQSAEIARRLILDLGGRYSLELGIDLDAGETSADAWLLAATLFGARISARTAVRTYRTLADAGVHTVLDAGERTSEQLVALLDAGGYARYDFRTATRVHQLADEIRDHHGGTISTLASIAGPRDLEEALDALPGWGPTTVRIFLRELRDVWPGAQPPLEERALRAARDLKLPIPRRHSDQLDALARGRSQCARRRAGSRVSARATCACPSGATTTSKRGLEPPGLVRRAGWTVWTIVWMGIMPS